MDLRILIAGRIPEDLRHDLALLEPSVQLSETEAGARDPFLVLADPPHLVVLGANAPFAARDLTAREGESTERVPVLAIGEDPDADLDRALETLDRRNLVRLARRLGRMRRALGQVRGCVPEGFERRLEYEFSRALRFRHPLSLILLRHDDVERLTGLYGTDALAEYSTLLEAALRRSLRDVDLLFRIAGDELAAILPETPAPGGIVVAKRFLSQSSSLVYKPTAAGSRPILPMKITSSLGVAEGPREGVRSSAELLLRASESVQAAASSGGGRASVDPPAYP